MDTSPFKKGDWKGGIPSVEYFFQGEQCWSSYKVKDLLSTIGFSVCWVFGRCLLLQVLLFYAVFIVVFWHLNLWAVLKALMNWMVKYKSILKQIKLITHCWVTFALVPLALCFCYLWGCGREQGEFIYALLFQQDWHKGLARLSVGHGPMRIWRTTWLGFNSWTLGTSGCSSTQCLIRRWAGVCHGIPSEGFATRFPGNLGQFKVTAQQGNISYLIGL